jgi:hypothetical protein
MDNQVKPTRMGSFEALMGTVRDTLIVGMMEQRLENKNKHINEPESRIRFKKPSEALGFIYEEIPTFDVEYAKELGYIFQTQLIL